jgi:hypothetical protein
MSETKNKLLYDYINAHMKQKGYLKSLPFVFFSKDDYNIGLYILIEKNLEIKDVKICNNDTISCRHFPYNCEESNLYEHFTKHTSYKCFCKSPCQCKKETPLYRSYIPFTKLKDINCFHSHICEEECCNFYKIKERYVVYIK